MIGEDLSRLRQFACRFPQQCPSLQAIEELKRAFTLWERQPTLCTTMAVLIAGANLKKESSWPLGHVVLLPGQDAPQLCWTDHVEQPIAQNAPEADLRNVPIDIISVNSSEVDSESSGVDDSSDGEADDASSTSSESSGSEPPASEVSNHHAMIGDAHSATQGGFKVDKEGYGYAEPNGSFPTTVASGQAHSAP